MTVWEFCKMIDLIKQKGFVYALSGIALNNFLNDSSNQTESDFNCIFRTMGLE